MRNSVHLITYVDRLSAGGITQLGALLRGPLNGLFGGVHLLPFSFPIDGADAGFDPIDHTQIDPRLGVWADLKALADDIQVMADLIVNHISSRSAQFQDFLCNGFRSRYGGLFLTSDAVFPAGPSASDLEAIYRPRPGVPFTLYTLENGESRLLWTTFTSQQIDIDVRDSQGVAYLERALEKPVVQDLVRLIRLRNSHAAFGGQFHLEQSPDHTLDLRWERGPDFVHLQVWFDAPRYTLEVSADGGVERFVFACAVGSLE
jgi:sucrose phosphorylase